MGGGDEGLLGSRLGTRRAQQRGRGVGGRGKKEGRGAKKNGIRKNRAALVKSFKQGRAGVAERWRGPRQIRKRKNHWKLKSMGRFMKDFHKKKRNPLSLQKFGGK